MTDYMRLAPVVTGGGSTMHAIITATRPGGELHGKVEVPLVIATKPGIAAIDKARELGVENVLMMPKSYFPGEGEYGEALLRALHEHSIDLLGLYGCLTKIPDEVVEAYEGRSVNQHPGALDPGHLDFGGEGMYGKRVLCAALYYERKMQKTNPVAVMTAQRVGKKYDVGAVIGTVDVSIQTDDTVDTLAKRTLPCEHWLQINVLKKFVEGSVRELPRERIAPDGLAKEILANARDVGITLYPKG